LILSNSTRKGWHLILASVAVFTLVPFAQPGQTFAQTLDQQVNQLLARQCAGLNLGGSILGLGQNLAEICTLGGNSGGAGGGGATGGGAASVQGSAASILNRVLLQRLDETDDEEGQDHQRSSSMRLNPFSSLLSGFGRSSSVSSPFYAATSGDGSSSAAFATSSHSRWNGLAQIIHHW